MYNILGFLKKGPNFQELPVTVGSLCTSMSKSMKLIRIFMFAIVMLRRLGCPHSFKLSLAFCNLRDS